MSNVVTSVRVHAMKNGQEQKRTFSAADHNGPSGCRQAAMRIAAIWRASDFAVTVREFYEDGRQFDFVYP